MERDTLLRIISGLDTPSSGAVLIDGAPVSGTAQDRGFIFQAVGLYPWRNTIQNVEFFLELKGVEKTERRRIAMEKLELVGLADFVNYPPVQSFGRNATESCDCEGSVHRAQSSVDG